MKEIKINLHIHTMYSDGSKSHAEIIKCAAEAGLDAIIFTDHNVFVQGIEGYHHIKGKKILVIMGEEVHDPNAKPQKNHLLALGINRDISRLSNDRQNIIQQIHDQQGGAFLAHPFDPALPHFNEPDISWEDWSVKDFDGIELWNGFSELKVRSKSKFHPYLYAFFPKFLPEGPPQRAIEIWDDLLARGQKFSAIGGTDAHAITFAKGPLKRVLFPYQYHFESINNYLLIEDGLRHDFLLDKSAVITALREGRNYIVNDLIHDGRGFRFFISDETETRINMGDLGYFTKQLSARAILPVKAEILLYHNGKCIKRFNNVRTISHPITAPGVYRLECYRRSRGKKRGWIFSNPIYITEEITPSQQR